MVFAGSIIPGLAICRALAFVLLFREGGAVINQAGFLLDTLGGYFVLRFLIQDHEDIKRAIVVLSFVCVIVAAGMLNEHIGHINVWGYLGGLRVIPELREGALRAQGPFEHALLAGTFGATLFPLFVWLWVGGKSKTVSGLGMISSVTIALTSASSTPMLALGAGIFGICMWPFRRHLRIVRWGIVIALIVLAGVMKAPMWFVISHIDLISGSSGYHRALLIDQFVRNFSDWWLIGTNNNGNWGWDLWDTCNQFVQEGESGGLVTFILFVTLIVICFKRLGNARRGIEGDKIQEWFYWLLGTALFAHVVAFFGIAYFDQTRMVWFVTLSIIVAATAALTVANPVLELGARLVPLERSVLAGKYAGPAGAPNEPSFDRTQLRPRKTLSGSGVRRSVDGINF